MRVLLSPVVALALSGVAGAMGTCPLRASLTGDGAAVGSVGAALKARGIQGDAADGCTALRVALTRSEGGLRVEALDPVGISTARVVTSPNTAAALIESWLRTDIAAPLLLATVLPPAPSGPAAT